MSNLQPVHDLDYGDLDRSDDLEVIQLVGLKLGDEEYAIDVLKIQEIIRTVEITSVPRTESFVLGVMNLRGKVIPVIDLRVRFSLDKMDFDKETRIIVVKFETENIGFVVDEVTEVIRINKKMVEPTPPLVGSIGQEYILGICKYADRLIILLDIDSVVTDGKTVDSNLKKTLLGQPALPSAEANYNKVASAVEQEFQNKETAAPAAALETSTEEEEEEESAFEEGSADDAVGASLDDLIAMELAKREQETDELNSKKKEDGSKKKPDVEPEALDDILNDALNQSSSNMSDDSGHVEQDELDMLIQKELTKREHETEELNKKKKIAEPVKAKAEPEPELTSEDDIEAMMAAELDAQFAAASEPSQDEISEPVSEEEPILNELITEEPAEEAPVQASEEPEFDIPADLAAEFDLTDTSEPAPEEEELPEPEPVAETAVEEEPEYELPEPIENEIGDEIIGKGLPDDFDTDALIQQDTEEEEEAPAALIDQINEPMLASENDDDIDVDKAINELKAESDLSPATEQESFEKLKVLSKKIIDGESVDFGISIKKEVAELLKLISETKDRVDEIEPTLITSKEQLPNVVKSLETVTESTEEATMNLMEAADGLTGHYQEFLAEMDDLEDLLYKKDQAAILKKIESLENSAAQADMTGMGILHALEFQDITEQKINKVIGAVQEIGARLGAILGFIRLKQEEDPTLVDDASQDDIDKLLAEFGLN
ncbi:MAG: chemotaxis protein CheW [Deferribacterales bacterium]